MRKMLYYLPRVLAIAIVIFFGLFILEGFSPKFVWQDSLMHGLLALVALGATIVAWRWPKIGGWLFGLFGIWYFVSMFQSERLVEGLLIGGVPLVTGMLFLIEGFTKKKA